MEVAVVVDPKHLIVGADIFFFPIPISLHTAVFLYSGLPL
jgi:hypothetical protein